MAAVRSDRRLAESVRTPDPRRNLSRRRNGLRNEGEHSVDGHACGRLTFKLCCKANVAVAAQPHLQCLGSTLL